MKTLQSLILVLLAVCSYAAVVIRPSVEKSPAVVRLGRSRSSLDPLHLEVEAFGEKHTLRLLPAPSPLSDDFKIQTTDYDDDGTLMIFDEEEEEDIENEAVISDLYHDPETGSVVRIEGDKVEGFISPHLSIQVAIDGSHEAIRQYTPIPEDIVNDYLNVPEGVLHGDTATEEEEETRSVLNVSPEVYVIVDTTLASSIGSNKKVKQYLSVFWGAVNQRFATISDPKINLVLAGCFIIRRKTTEPFINDNKLMDNYIHGENTLNSVSDWLYTKKGQFPKYDLAYLMTGMDMADVESGTIQKGLAGIAWKGAACVVATANKRSFNTAMGEDQGGSYTGVMTAAHEVAHNLGSPHDGSNGAESCSWDDGFIMSYVSGSPNKLFFSSCSQNEMKKYMSSSGGACLKRTDVGSKLGLSSKLPGELISMDEQCQKSTGKTEAFASKSAVEDSLCVQLVCQWKVTEGNSIWTYTQTSGRPAAEGSPCRSGGKCTNGKCI